jgi:hypothetical protein
MAVFSLGRRDAVNRMGAAAPGTGGGPGPLQGWKEQPQQELQTMVSASHIKERMEVKGADGKHVGTVDGMEGGRIRLASGGMMHTLDLEAVEDVKEGVARLKQTAQEATRPWH